MAKEHLLLVDADPKALTLTEVNLRHAGFVVTTAVNGADALEKCRAMTPDLVISETRMPEMDGFALCQRLKEDERLRRIPFIFLTSQKTVEFKVTGLELGVDDYLTKPIYFKEILTRISILLQRRERERLERREQKGSFSGDLTDVGLVDLLQTLEMGKKSGALQIHGPGDRAATVYVSNGKVIDAEVGELSGEAAFYRILNWEEGQFGIAFKPVARAERITVTTQSLIMEGLRRIDELARLLEQLPQAAHVVSIDYEHLDVLGELPGHVHALLRLVDGRRTLGEVLTAAECGDLAAAEALTGLFRAGALRDGVRAAPPAAPSAPPPAAAVPAPDAAPWFAPPDDGEGG